MITVYYLKTVEHPQHLAGEPGATRELHDADAYLLEREGYVRLPEAPPKETDERIDQGINPGVE